MLLYFPHDNYSFVAYAFSLSCVGKEVLTVLLDTRLHVLCHILTLLQYSILLGVKCTPCLIRKASHFAFQVMLSNLWTRMFPSRKCSFACFVNSRSLKSRRRRMLFLPRLRVDRGASIVLWQFVYVDHAIFDRLSLGTVVSERVSMWQLLSRDRCPFFIRVVTMNVLVSGATHWKNALFQPIQCSSLGVIHRHEHIVERRILQSHIVSPFIWHLFSLIE